MFFNVVNIVQKYRQKILNDLKSILTFVKILTVCLAFFLESDIILTKLSYCLMQRTYAVPDTNIQ